MNRQCELRIDSFLLARIDRSQAWRVVQDCSDAERLWVDRLLADPQTTQRLIPASPVDVGAYLASRLTRQGFAFSDGVDDAMYALCDSLRHVSLLDILRWRHVLTGVAVHASPLADAAADLLRQSRDAIGLLVDLAHRRDVRWEQRVLGA